MLHRSRWGVFSLCLLAGMMPLIIGCQKGNEGAGGEKEGPTYAGRWDCASEAKKGFFEIVAKDGTFLAMDRTWETYSGSVDEKNTLVLEGPKKEELLHLQISAEGSEFFCSACECDSYVKDEDLDSAEKEALGRRVVNRAAQNQTLRDIRNVGTAMMSWVTDQVGAGAAGQRQLDLAHFAARSHSELAEMIAPLYIRSVPEVDGWGHPYEFYLNTDNFFASTLMSIRSPGLDGTFSGTVYQTNSFEAESFEEDIVWSDGFFVRYPKAIR